MAHRSGLLLVLCLILSWPAAAYYEAIALDFSVFHVFGGYAPVRPTYEVIRDANQWRRFRGTANVSGPQIDFRKFTLVVAATGQKPAAGYSVVIAGTRDVPIENSMGPQRETTVLVMDVGPGSCPRATQLSRTEAVFALIPRKNEYVNFRVHHVGADCSDNAPGDELIDSTQVG